MKQPDTWPLSDDYLGKAEHLLIRAWDVLTVQDVGLVLSLVIDHLKAQERERTARVLGT